MMPELPSSDLAEAAMFSLYKFAVDPSRKAHSDNPNIPA
jgi:hypothetical protein